LRRLAQRFGALADNAPRLWLLVGGTDARAIDPVESAPLSGGANLREVVRSWEPERRPGGYSAFLVTNTPGDHSAADSAAHRLIEHAAEALRALGDPVSERPLLRWAERLEGLADAGDASVSITRRRVRPLAPEGETPSPALGWTIGLRVPVDADGSGPWFGLIEPDAAEASRLFCLHLADGIRPGGAVSSVRKMDGWTRSELIAQATHDGAGCSPATFDRIRREAGIKPGKPDGRGQQRRFSHAELRRLIGTAESGTYRDGRKIAAALSELLAE